MKRLVLILSVVLLFINLAFAENQFFIKPNSSWVQNRQYAPNYRLNTDNKEDGGIYLLLDYQQNVALQELYQHFVIKIEEESGIQNYSDLWVDYDPSYQKLIFHKLVLHRNNQEIDRLKENDFKIVQNETELHRKIYSGHHSAGINIKGVQVGDIIEYSYTIKGENPIFNGKYINSFYLDFSAPIKEMSLQVIYSKNRTINYKLIKSDKQPKKTIKNNEICLQWELNNIEEVVSNSNTPSWYITYGKVHLSEFSSWADVVQWSKPLYKKVDISNTSLETKVIELTKDVNSTSKKIDKLISFVQDEIRYVGIEVNEYSHKPHNPLEVYTNRYGDCKDKSYLLVTLLKHLGVEAYPAYVNTSLKQNISQLLPSPTNFDHVIVAINLNNETYFVDPTKVSQKANFETANCGNFKKALVLSDKFKEPIDIPIGSNEKIVIKETIDVEDTTKPAKYSVICSYYGNEADQMRSSFKNNTPKEQANSYLNFYANIYPSMKVVGDIKTEENEKDNSFKVYENYEIDKFWIFDNSASINDYVSTINATNLFFYVSVPAQKNRKMPFALYYPIEIENQIKFNIHKKITTDKTKGEINNPNFKFTYNIRTKGETVVFNYTFKTLKDYVSVNELDQYYQDIDKVSDIIWNRYTYGNSTSSEGLNWLMVILSIFFVIILVFFASTLYKRDINSTSLQQAPLPIGGWLLLPVIGVIVSSIIFAYNTIAGGYFNSTSWDFISSTDSVGYDIFWAVAFIFELLTNWLFLIYTLFLFLLIIKRRTIFPMHFVSFWIIHLVAIIAGAILVSQIKSEHFENMTDFKDIGRNIVAAFIWIPYMLKSQRVKDTFTKTYKNTEKREMS